MNIFEALFGSTDLYQKAQARIKSRIERKQILENRGFGSMPQKYETESRPVSEKQGCEEKETIMGNTDELLKAIETMQKTMEEQAASLKEMQKSMEERCSSIEDKVHSENVKSYRNVQAALDDMNKGVAKEDSLVLLVSSLRTQLKCVTWFSVITLLVLIAYILFSLGVF